MLGNGEAVRELVLPYRGERLRGPGVRRRVEKWVAAGIVEPSVGEAIDAVLDHPGWLRLEGHTVIILGAGAEMGPLPSLMRWARGRSRSTSTDPRSGSGCCRWSSRARGRCGHRCAPDGTGPSTRWLASTCCATCRRCSGGCATSRARWCSAITSTPTAPTNLRLSVAVDELTRRLQSDRDDTALGLPGHPHRRLRRARGAVAHRHPQPCRSPIRGGSGGYRRAAKESQRIISLSGTAYAAGTDPGSTTRWCHSRGQLRAGQAGAPLAGHLARHDAALVSITSPLPRAPVGGEEPALAAAYAGAHRFGVEVFDPSTSNVLMAALLVHDLHTGGGPQRDQPWQHEAYAAAHGGLWRTAYAPRSALGLAAVLGYGATRG